MYKMKDGGGRTLVIYIYNKECEQLLHFVKQYNWTYNRNHGISFVFKERIRPELQELFLRSQSLPIRDVLSEDDSDDSRILHCKDPLTL